MKIKRIEIQNFRSIIDPLIIDDVRSLMVFTGPNNIGKSNILKALDLFFNDTIEGENYDPERDSPYGLKDVKTQIKVRLLIEKREANVRRHIKVQINDKNLRDEYLTGIGITYDPKEPDSPAITIHVFDSITEKEIGEILTSIDSSELILKYINYIYVPSAKDVRRMIEEYFSEEMKNAVTETFGGGRTKSRELKRKREGWRLTQKEIRDLFTNLSKRCTVAFKEIFPEIKTLEIAPKQYELKQALGELQISIDDGADTSLFFKGSGVQSISILNLLRILSMRPRPAGISPTPVWAIEEPETFLHPKAQRQVAKKLIDDSKRAQIFITTHSPLFLCRGDKDANKLLEKKNSKMFPSISTTDFLTIEDEDIWKPFREELGLDIRDTLLFHNYNVIVEGETDIYLLKEVTKQMLQKNDPKVIPLSQIAFRRYRGADAIPVSFDTFRTLSDEAKILAIFDNDEKGKNTLNNLKTKGFKEGKDFILYKRRGFKNCDLENLADKDVLEKIINEYPQKSNIIKNEEHYHFGTRYIFHRDQKMHVVEKIIENSSYEQLDKYINLIHKIYNIFTRSGQLKFDETIDLP